MCFGCIILGIEIPCSGLWVSYFFLFFVQNSRICMSAHPKSCAELLFVCTRFMEGCSQHNSLLPPTPAMPAPILTPTVVCQWMKSTQEKNNLLLSETQFWFQNAWGPHEKIWECRFDKKNLVKYCYCELKVTNTQGRELPTSGKKGVCPSGFSAPEGLWLRMRHLSCHLFLVFFEMPWLV